MKQNLGLVLFTTISAGALLLPRLLPLRRKDRIIQNWFKRQEEHAMFENVDNEEVLSWVRQRNNHAYDKLGDPENSPLFNDVLSIVESKDRIPHVSKVDDYYYNFWTDDKNPRGILRRTTLDSYMSASPSWEVVLDIDDLNTKEGKSWVYKGHDVYKAEEKGVKSRRCLFKLSDGGADATTVREFDILDKKFITAAEGGFELPQFKNSCSWIDIDTLLIGTDYGDGKSVTDSGYPMTVRKWKRNTSYLDAEFIFSGNVEDVIVTGYRSKHQGKSRQMIQQAPSFYTNNVFLLSESGHNVNRVPKQDSASCSIFSDNFLIELRDDWTVDGLSFTSGSLLSIPVQTMMSGVFKSSDIQVLFTPSALTSLEDYSKTYNYLILTILDNVKSKVQFWKLSDNNKDFVKTSEEVDGKIRGINLRAVDSEVGDDLWVTSSSFTSPSQLCMMNANEGAQGILDAKRIKVLPSLYDSSNVQELQYFATSADGTSIPYFVIGPKDMVLDGLNPTLLYGYGGFEISLTPAYSAIPGKCWLEKGGVYVMANIRGGGEFGPKWHQAALQEKRNKAYEDFIAVAEELIAKRITSTPHLGIRGGSNGGLLMGNMYTMRPDLWGAVVCQVPLLDMYRYSHLLAGASWMAEYGNPDTSDWSFLKRYSAYHNIDPEEDYPPLLMTTSTKDDRVHPYHARSFVKRLLECFHAGKEDKENDKVYYYENIEGGHGGAADPKQTAGMNALIYEFLWKKLKK